MGTRKNMLSYTIWKCATNISKIFDQIVSFFLANQLCKDYLRGVIYIGQLQFVEEVCHSVTRVSLYNL